MQLALSYDKTASKGISDFNAKTMAVGVPSSLWMRASALVCVHAHAWGALLVPLSTCMPASYARVRVLEGAYAHLCVCVCVRARTHTHVGVDSCMPYACVARACGFLCACGCVCTCADGFARALCVYVLSCLPACPRVFMSVYACMYARAHMHMHSHVLSVWQEKDALTKSVQDARNSAGLIVQNGENAAADIIKKGEESATPQ